jgi:hypothetical protein
MKKGVSQMADTPVAVGIPDEQRATQTQRPPQTPTVIAVTEHTCT